MIRLLAFLLLLPSLVMAQELPRLFDVTGVASDDVLNIRARPDASSPVVSAFSPDARNIEVLEITDGPRPWGLVNAGEGTGWVSMRYLLAQEAGVDSAAFPGPLSCFGTEPFWGFEIGPSGPAQFSMAEDAYLLSVQSRLRAEGRMDRHGFIAGSPDMILQGVVSRASCSDGMSDRRYGFALDLIVRGQSGHTLYSGCCQLQSQ